MDDSSDLEYSNLAPYTILHSKEYIEGLLKAGSVISMLENKKINMTTLFSLLIEKQDYREFFTEITSSNSFRESITTLLHLNPSLVKSKITKSLIKKGINKPNVVGTRKTNL